MTRAITTIDTTALALNERQWENLEALTARYTVNSRKAYQATWAHYQGWCAGAGRNPAALDAAQVLAYLHAHPARRSTQQARLSKLRTLARLLSDVTGDPALLAARALLDDLRLPLDMHAEPAPGASANDKHAPRQRRGKRALTRQQVYNALAHDWTTGALTARNRAIIAAGLYGWLRRSEIARLKWADVDFTSRTIAVRGGKKRAADTVELIDMPDELADALRAWKVQVDTDADEAARLFTRTYVFCRVSKAGKLLEDKPLTGEAIRLVFDDAGFMPHDARRTGITRALEAGTPLNIAQRRARHKQGAMTMEYAKYVDLAEVRAGTKQGY